MISSPIPPDAAAGDRRSSPAMYAPRPCIAVAGGRPAIESQAGGSLRSVDGVGRGPSPLVEGRGRGRGPDQQGRASDSSASLHCFIDKNRFARVAWHPSEPCAHKLAWLAAAWPLAVDPDADSGEARSSVATSTGPSSKRGRLIRECERRSSVWEATLALGVVGRPVLGEAVPSRIPRVKACGFTPNLMQLGQGHHLRRVCVCQQRHR
jgi:hypothetical protein